jgi:hypothetical protein
MPGAVACGHRPAPSLAQLAPSILRDILALGIVGKAPRPEWLMTSAAFRLGVSFDLAIPMPFSGLFDPSLGRLSYVVILTSLPRLPTSRWRPPGVRVFPVRRRDPLKPPPCRVTNHSRDGRWRVSDWHPFGCATGSSFHHGSLVVRPCLEGSNGSHDLVVSVVRVFSSTLLPGFTGPESSVLSVNLPPFAPFPFRALRYRVRFLRQPRVAGHEGFPG